MENDSLLRELKSIVETWGVRKRHNRMFTLSDLQEFVKLQNVMSKRMIKLMEVTDPDFYTSMAELATNAATLVTPGAKIVLDGTDVTDR